MIRQGDVYWVEDEEPVGSEPGYTRPYVVIQNDFFNDSRLKTVIACAVTTTLRRANSPENVRLEQGEAGLREQSVVLASQTVTLDKDQLGPYVGTLSPARVTQIL